MYVTFLKDNDVLSIDDDRLIIRIVKVKLRQIKVVIDADKDIKIKKIKGVMNGKG